MTWLRTQSNLIEAMDLDDLSQDTVWKAVVVTAAGIAGVAMRKGLKSGWKAIRGADPPENPASPDVDWREAVLWSVASGTAVGLARLFARRAAAAEWRRRFGTLPPGL